MEYQYRSPLEGSYDDDGPRPRRAPEFSPYARTAHGGGHGNMSWPSSSSLKPSASHSSYLGSNSLPTASTDSSYHRRPYETTPQSQPKYSDRYRQPSYPRELTDMFGALECRLCAVEVQSPIVAKMHYSGKPHMKKIKNYLLEWSSRTGLSMPKVEEPILSSNSVRALEDYCKVCDVKMASLNEKVLHYSGKNHQKNVRDPANARKRKKGYETFDMSRFGIGSGFKKETCNTSDDVKEFFCDVCDVKAVSKEQLAIHLGGKKHKEKLEKKNCMVPYPVNPSASILASVVKDQPRDIDYSMHRTPTGSKYVCKICSIGLPTKNMLELHLHGKKHIKNVSKMGLDESCPKERCSIACKYCTFVGILDNHKCDKSLLNIDYETVQNKWVCHTCYNMVFDSEEEYNIHKLSRRHTICSINEESGDVVEDKMEHLYCRVCKTQYRNDKEYVNHFFEEKHLSLSENQVLIESKTDLYHCPLCNLFMDEEANNEHLKDPKHLKKALFKDTLEYLSTLAHEELDTNNFECVNCNITLTSFMSYSQHLLHDNTHVNRVIEEKLSKNE